MKHIVKAAVLLFIPFMVKADVQPHSLFSDHMVLQKGAPVPVWGLADEGEKVTVKFNGQTVSAITKYGKWMLKLAPMPYITTPQTMTITGKNTVTIKDVLVGEVWLCSGQSNMERQLGLRPGQPPITDWEKERDEANFPLIREYYVPLKYTPVKVADVHNQWTVCSPQTVTDFTAVGFFFARDLYKKMKVPVGIIFSAFGGTPAEDWTSREALESDTALADLVKNYDKIIPSYKPAGKLMSGLYNGMIYPLIPYAIKGVAWYQGESNNDRPKQYQAILPNMIRNWRTDFKQGDFPFLIVQIAPYRDMKPEIREAQLLVTQKVKNTALIVTTDCGDANDIHPAHKQPVGERLALAALGLAYHHQLVFAGPLMSAYKVKGDSVELTFDNVGKGLNTGDKAGLRGFMIAGADKQYKPASAIIRRNKVIVYSNAVKSPVDVRYGWANVPDGNLCNSAGLPASPFRTEKGGQQD